MRPMSAVLVSEWHFERANVFALCRERCFAKDTIPKPGGLGLGGEHGGFAVRCLSDACPVSVRDLSGATWKRHFSAF
jgi:hypothetical protein